MASRKRSLPTRRPAVSAVFLAFVVFLSLTRISNGFSPTLSTARHAASSYSSSASKSKRPPQMSFYDMSDYSSSASDFDEDADDAVEQAKAAKYASMTAAERADYEAAADAEPKLEQPPPLSKNAGNAFVAMIFDKAMDVRGRDWEELMEDRMDQTEDHVRWCREANLYNETFNADSNVDVLKNYQVLSSCATRPIGHILILESTDLANIKSFLATDPIVQSLGCTVDDIPLYRWRHIKDYTLRMDDGREGYPNVLIQMDRSAEELGGSDIRSTVEKAKLEYMIRSQRVIAAGPIHLPTELKDDPSSLPVGDIVFFNAMDRDEAIQFAENDPASLAGLYGEMRVHKYNTVDVTGKFVSKNLHTLDDNSGSVNRNLHLKEQMRNEGYPVKDDETPWFNY
mmetsp:Transcript_3609/g.7862  ORF Transcript_3609/g.7862 Transcript_3609/m.7862 type:complete len:398 (+) Transcript_3609:136-1329(+)